MVRLKKRVLTIIAFIVLVTAFMLAHKVYAGNPVISLNSPVSFPVDI